MRSSDPLRLSGYGGGDVGGWLAWLRDARRPRAEGQAAAVVPAVAAASPRRAVPPPERRGPPGGARDRPGPPGPRVTGGVGRPPDAPSPSRAPVAAARTAMPRQATAPGVTPETLPP